MEILGLVFVVILIVLGLLMLLLFVGRGQQSLKRFTESAVAKNYLTTLAQTHTPCRGFTFEQLFQECASGAGTKCGDGTDVCAFAQDAMDGIFQETLTTWHRNYSLVVSTGEEALLQSGLIRQGKRCRGDVEGAFYPIPFAGTFILMNLSLCA